ncbi:hypothetical protein ABUW04_38780 [Streptacidiphilus sp. N1-10]|uniref:Integral membrane protein n=1 Tax=Streptacidiphilus jeojiensis TaxID=3229225 RepID=A0ABV6Y104_9ACTN
MEKSRPGVRLTALRVLRGTVVLAGLLAFGQPVLAGGFLQGHYPLLQAHEVAAMILAAVVLLSLVVALLAWRPGGAPGALPRGQLITLVVIAVQMMLGFSRELIIHVPLGVGVLILVLKNAERVWKLPLRAPAAGAAEPSEQASPAEVDA